MVWRVRFIKSFNVFVDCHSMKDTIQILMTKKSLMESWFILCFLEIKLYMMPEGDEY